MAKLTKTREHPLAPYRDRITPRATYTVHELARLLETDRRLVTYWISYGWFPGAKLRPLRSGGPERYWTGTQLRKVAARPLRVKLDHDAYGPLTLWRLGCRCLGCTAAHNETDREWRRALADEKFTPAQRERLLDLARSQRATVAEAAEKVGVSVHQVYGLATRDAEFASALDEAGWEVCVFGSGSPRCGTPGAYAGNKKSRVPRPPCRGTGCRVWRRQAAQDERARAAQQ